jgi:hypothetical protein
MASKLGGVERSVVASSQRLNLSPFTDARAARAAVSPARVLRRFLSH